MSIQPVGCDAKQFHAVERQARNHYLDSLMGRFIAIVLCEILASAPVVCHFSVAGGTRSPCLAVSEASVMGIQLYHF